ncbi:MAG: hypothetical protein H0X35_09380, partial [Pseudonocardiales bacterium]|nr:hypothetical protein [Pseudonocardiales bacterium]
LYGSNVHDIAMLGLYWDQGLLSEHPELVDRLPWARALVMAARGDPAADTLIAAELARPAPVLWTTHPRLTMLAHAVADRGLRAQAAELRPRLEPLAHCVANWGQVGVVGVVALGLARLCAVLDDLDAARAHLATAYAVTRRARGGGTLVRCRLLALQLDAQQRRPVDVTAARIVADDAARRGMRGVARDAEALIAAAAVGRSENTEQTPIGLVGVARNRRHPSCAGAGGEEIVK